MKDVIKMLARIKRKLVKKPFVKDKRYPAFWINEILKREKTLLVQIGSNDGKTGDPFYPLLQKNKNWKALFVEPVPYSFEELKKNYPDANRFRFEQVAINNGEEMTFYWVDSQAEKELTDLPFWYNQLGSFDKEHILKHLDGTLAPFIRSKPLEGISLHKLFDRNQIDRVDVLHIDTEGYDWNILSQLNLETHQPKFILYEHNHLSPADLKASYAFLEKDYLLFKIGIDVFSVHRKLDNGFLKKLIGSLQHVQIKS